MRPKPEDLARLECLLVTQGHFFPIRIEGLTAEGMTKLEVSEEYRKIGLYRHRRVFVARDSDGEAFMRFATIPLRVATCRN